MKILITGVSAGIGHALAERMLAQGHEVWGISRHESAGLHGQFTHSKIDIMNPVEVRAACNEMKTTGFLPDAVVLNAGIYPHDSDTTFQYDVAEKIIATNLNGALIFVDAFLPEFLSRKSGQFLAVSSVLGMRPDPEGASYAASKAGLTMAFRSLALRYAGTGVRFSSILLGPIDTETASSKHREGPATSAHIPSAKQAAAAIEKALRGKKTLSYYPWLLGMIFRFTAWMPDGLFQRLTMPFRR